MLSIRWKVPHTRFILLKSVWPFQRYPVTDLQGPIDTCTDKTRINWASFFVVMLLLVQHSHLLYDMGVQHEKTLERRHVPHYERNVSLSWWHKSKWFESKPLFSSSPQDLADKISRDCRSLSYVRVDKAQTWVSCNHEDHHRFCCPLGSRGGKFQVVCFLNTDYLVRKKTL